MCRKHRLNRLVISEAVIDDRQLAMQLGGNASAVREAVAETLRDSEQSFPIARKLDQRVPFRPVRVDIGESVQRRTQKGRGHGLVEAVRRDRLPCPAVKKNGEAVARCDSAKQGTVKELTGKPA